MAVPDFPAFVSSLFVATSSAELHAVITVVISSLLQVYLITCASQVLILFSGPIILFMFTMCDLLSIKISSFKAAQLGLTSVPKVLQMREKLHKELRVYKCVQLRVDEVNDLFASAFGQVDGVVISNLILWVYGFYGMRVS